MHTFFPLSAPPLCVPSYKLDFSVPPPPLATLWKQNLRNRDLIWEHFDITLVAGSTAEV